MPKKKRRKPAPHPQPERLVSISASVRPDTLDQIETEARERGVSRATIIRELLDAAVRDGEAHTATDDDEGGRL